MTRTRTKGIEIETRQMGGLFMSRDDGGRARMLSEDEVDALREYLEAQDAEQMRSVGVEFNALDDAHSKPAQKSVEVSEMEVLTIHIVHQEQGREVRQRVDPDPPRGPVPHDYSVKPPTITVMQWDGTNVGANAIAEFVPKGFTVGVSIDNIVKRLSLTVDRFPMTYVMNPGDFVWVHEDPTVIVVADEIEFTKRYKEAS